MIHILYQDKELAVCRKPAGLLSQDGPGDTLPSLLRGQLGGDIFPVRRLDREDMSEVAAAASQNPETAQEAK